MMKTIMKRIMCVMLCILLLMGMCACGNDEGKETDKKDIANVDELAITDELKSVFYTKNVVNETVLFMEDEETKTLLYKPDKIVSVTSYDGKITYEEGVDYELKDGKLVLLSGSSIPCINKSDYYPAEQTGVTIYLEENISYAPLYWGDGDAMTKWQVCVNYTHSDSWVGYKQESNSDRYSNFVQKLKDGEDVTVQFYGDNITVGANSSFQAAMEPEQYPYTILFLQTLAEVFDYTIKFVDLYSDVTVPKEDLILGERGTITCVNNAVKNLTTEQALSDFDMMVKTNLDDYGCDLFVLALGIKDVKEGAESVVANQKKILEKVIKTVPNVSLMLVSTMIPHPETNVDVFQDEQEVEMLRIADELNSAGNPCAVACMTSVSKSVCEFKDYQDCSGNNVDEPNDFMSRIYAHTLFQTLIGYENVKSMIVSE